MSERNLGGRPRIFSWSLAETILSAIRAGAYVEDAAEFASISRDTHYAWLREGDTYLEQAQALAESEAAKLVSTRIEKETERDAKGVRQKRKAALNAEIAAIEQRVNELERQPWMLLSKKLERDLARFSDTYRKALRECELRYLTRIDKATQKDGRLALEFLSRRHPEKYGRRRLELTGANGGAIESRHVFVIPSNGREGPGVEIGEFEQEDESSG